MEHHNECTLQHLCVKLLFMEAMETLISEAQLGLADCHLEDQPSAEFIESRNDEFE